MRVCAVNSDINNPSICGAPATHAAYDKDGKLHYYCAEHYDGLTRLLKHWAERGMFLDEIEKVKELNPGLL